MKHTSELAAALESFPDIHDGRVPENQLIESVHKWEAQYWTALQRAAAREQMFDEMVDTLKSFLDMDGPIPCLKLVIDQIDIIRARAILAKVQK